MNSAILGQKIRMRFLYGNRHSTDDKSRSSKRHTSQASDAGQAQFLIESYIQLRFVELSRVENLFVGFITAALRTFQGFCRITWTLIDVSKGNYLFSLGVKQSAVFGLLVSAIDDATFFRNLWCFNS